MDATNLIITLSGPSNRENPRRKNCQALQPFNTYKILTRAAYIYKLLIYLPIPFALASAWRDRCDRLH